MLNTLHSFVNQQTIASIQTIVQMFTFILKRGLTEYFCISCIFHFYVWSTIMFKDFSEYLISFNSRSHIFQKNYRNKQKIGTLIKWKVVSLSKYYMFSFIFIKMDIGQPIVSRLLCSYTCYNKVMNMSSFEIIYWKYCATTETCNQKRILRRLWSRGILNLKLTFLS